MRLERSFGARTGLLHRPDQESFQVVAGESRGRRGIDHHSPPLRVKTPAVYSAPIGLGDGSGQLENHVDTEVCSCDIQLAQLVHEVVDLRTLKGTPAVEDSKREGGDRLVSGDAFALLVEPLYCDVQVARARTRRAFEAVLVVQEVENVKDQHRPARAPLYGSLAEIIESSSPASAGHLVRQSSLNRVEKLYQSRVRGSPGHMGTIAPSRRPFPAGACSSGIPVTQGPRVRPRAHRFRTSAASTLQHPTRAAARPDSPVARMR